jgi:hypothetical protein
MRLLLGLLMTLLVASCGAPAGEAPAADRDADVDFLTELMHRDAALLNLLDVGLGRRLDPSVVTATDQLRIDAIARVETAADQLSSWGEKVPATVRDHGSEHSGHHDIPSLDGMPTGDDLQALGRMPRAAFEAAFVALLRDSLEATSDLAGSHAADAAAVQALARDAEQSCDATLDAL